MLTLKPKLFQVLTPLFIVVAGPLFVYGEKPYKPAAEECLFALTYPALAQQGLVEGLEDLIKTVESIEPEILPHEAIEARLDLRSFRISYDIFIYAYADEENRWWQRFRSLLNQGYEILGDYKDLFVEQKVRKKAVQYDPVELEAQRQSLLNWQQTFLEFIEEEGVRYKLASPERGHSRVYARLRQGELSRFYWGAGRGRPIRQATGLENVSLLLSKLLWSARKNYRELIPHEALFPKKKLVGDYEDTFHDFRKRLRSVKFILKLFPEINPLLHGSSDLFTEDRLKVVRQVYKKLGKINDDVQHFNFIKKQKKKSSDEKEVAELDAALEEMRDSINSQWAKLRKKMLRGSFAEDLRTLAFIFEEQRILDPAAEQ